MKIQWISRVLLVALAVVALSGTSRADGIPTGAVLITSGGAGTGTLSDSFFTSGHNLDLGSATPDGGEGVSFTLTQIGNQFLLATTIFADASNIELGLPCSGRSQSSGAFNGVTAECLQGSITFTSILTGPPCLSGGIFGCVGVTQAPSSPFVASGNISGWDTMANGTSTEVFDVLVLGQGSANIATGGPASFFTNYTFVTPEPSNLLLLGTGLLGVLGAMRRKLLA